MAEPQHPMLSELMDGELDAKRANTTIDALLSDPDMAAEWRRMHQLGGLLRGDVETPFDITAAVRDALADDPAYLLPGIAPARSPRRWPRYAMGGALAAGVALATVVGLRPWQLGAQPPQLATATPAPAVGVATLADAEQDRSSQAAYQANRLESYWAVHADNALLAGPESLSPLVHNVSAERRQ